jgi:hypothetical protein
MTITEITRIANNYTDEVFATSVCLDFANEAIAKVNVTLGATLPYMNLTSDYTALDEQWIRTVIVPYVSYSLKLNDGSINESQINFLQRYEQGVRELRKNKKQAIGAQDTDGNYIYRGDNFGGIATMPKLGTYEKHPDDITDEEEYNDKIPL